jgi:hypothetical protein
LAVSVRERALSRRKGDYLYLTLFVSLCFLNMAYLPFGLPLYYTSYFSPVLPAIALQTESRPGHGRFVATDHASIITFLLCVLCILLLISGIEPKVIWRMTGQDFDELGTDATNVINSKNDFFTKLSSKIASESRGSKQYWNIIKSLMNYDSTNSRYIPPYK